MRCFRFTLLALTLCPGISLIAQGAEAPTLHSSIDLGYRQDRGQWTIAGGPGGPNILSDLEWTDLIIAELRVQGEWRWDKMILGGRIAFGTMLDGANRDSDYLLDNRRGEFSRSTADTDGDTFDLEMYVGAPLRFDNNPLVLTPLLGFSYYQQNHTDTNGVQEIDRSDLLVQLLGLPINIGPEDAVLGPFDGLNSAYDAEWYGPYLGLSAHIPIGKRGSLLGRYQFHLYRYEGEMFWNLRNLPFSNEAEGLGHQFVINYVHGLSESMSLNLEVSYLNFESDEGTQTDPLGDITLNGAEWESLAAHIGLRWVF